MNICILIPGFIKSYKHLEYINKLINNLEFENVYVFGHIFNYLIKPNEKKNNIDYNNKDNSIDTDKLKLFTSYSFVDDDYNKFDDDGYDNRIYSQWYNIKKSYELYLDFSEKNNIKCDFFIRLRSDIKIKNINLCKYYIKDSYETDKMFFFKQHKKLTDQIFMGPQKYFEIICMLSDSIKTYYLLPYIIKKINIHKNKENKKDNNKYLRFGRESETLLRIHFKKNLQKNSYLIKNRINNLKRK